MGEEDFLVAKRFYDYQAAYPYLAAFIPQYAVLLAELQNILSASWLDWPEKHLYAEDNQWDIFPFFGFGQEVPQNCTRCPETYQLLKQIPDLRTAIYSRLGPKARLTPHVGPAHISNYCLRCHFGLIVPEGCGLWVEGEEHLQRPADWLVFDDSKPHSGFNNSSEQRVVLLLDIARPVWVPRGRLSETPTKHEGGLPDHWGTPEDFLKRDY